MSKLTIEVKCTEEEKETLVNTWGDASDCIFQNTGIKCDLRTPCRECVEKNIKWNITGESGGVNSVG